MKTTKIASAALIWVSAALGGYSALYTIDSIEDTDTTAAAIRKAGGAGIGVAVYVVSMNYLLKK